MGLFFAFNSYFAQIKFLFNNFTSLRAHSGLLTERIVYQWEALSIFISFRSFVTLSLFCLIPFVYFLSLIRDRTHYHQDGARSRREWNEEGRYSKRRKKGRLDEERMDAVLGWVSLKEWVYSVGSFAFCGDIKGRVLFLMGLHLHGFEVFFSFFFVLIFFSIYHTSLLSSHLLTMQIYRQHLPTYVCLLSLMALFSQA